MKNKYCASIFSLVFFLCAIPCWAQSNVRMSNGDYQPGAVLIYQSGSWEVATPDAVDYSENNYVYVHGANGSGTDARTQELARAILARYPDANFLSVDWTYWANFNEDKVDEIFGEQLQSYLSELFLASLWENLTGGEVDYEEILRRHMGQLFQRIILNIMPVEQTAYLPTVADRANTLLFYEKNTNWDFTTNDQKGTFISLGLDPKKTHLIGFSHGAHIAGMMGMYCRKENQEQVKRLTVLDPSNQMLHQSGENKDGNGWDRYAAKFIDVYRTSEICGTNKLYGDVNIYLRYKDHPLFRLDEAETLPDAISSIIQAFEKDLDLHRDAIAFYIRSINSDARILTVAVGSSSSSTLRDSWRIYDRDSATMSSALCEAISNSR